MLYNSSRNQNGRDDISSLSLGDQNYSASKLHENTTEKTITTNIHF